MKTKVCFVCNKRKKIDSFYTHSKMADGHLGKCKVCCREYHRSRDREIVRAIDNKRTQNPHRKAWKLANQLIQRKLSPGRFRARSAVSNAIRDGKLKKQPCESCGNNRAEAHHPDYRKKLQVRWLCPKCHLAHHRGSAPD